MRPPRTEPAGTTTSFALAFTMMCGVSALSSIHSRMARSR
jgi:hypothetical protein